MKKIFIFFFSLFTLTLLAQNPGNPDLEQEVTTLREKVETLETSHKTSNQRLNAEIRQLKDSLSAVSVNINSLQREIQINNEAIIQTANELGLKIDNAETSARQQIEIIDNSLSKTTLWAIIGILAAIVVSGVVFWLLNKKQKAAKTDMIKQLSKTKLTIDENLVKEFGKLAEMMDTQINLTKPGSNQGPDHSLPLKVANEINIIEHNINLMDSKTKGLKQLNRSVEKLKNNLTANGYDMPQLLRQPFHQGMKVLIT